MGVPAKYVISFCLVCILVYVFWAYISLESNSTRDQFLDERSATEHQSSFKYQRIKKIGNFVLKSILSGSLVDKRGVVATIKTPVRTELVFSFSPAAEDNFRLTLIDPNKEQTVFANSPAMIWDGEKFVVVMRMWLDKEATIHKVKNILADNYFFMRIYDDTMKPLDQGGRVLGIPARVVEDVGDGPIEPRAFYHYGRLYLSFNSGAFFGNQLYDTTFFWDLEQERVLIPTIVDGQPLLKENVKKSIKRDKHWSPFTWQSRLYFLYSPDPLRILSCEKNSTCSFYYNDAPNTYQFDDLVDCLRGGTPTVQYKDDYFITVLHVTLFHKVDTAYKRYYTTNLAVLKMGLKPQIIYLSEPMQFHRGLMNSIPIVRGQYISDPFLFPVTLLLEDTDSVLIAGHINDHSSYLFRLTGLNSLMRSVMSGSSLVSNLGPSPGFLHNLSKEFAANVSGYEFV